MDLCLQDSVNLDKRQSNYLSSVQTESVIGENQGEMVNNFGNTKISQEIPTSENEQRQNGNSVLKTKLPPIQHVRPLNNSKLENMEIFSVDALNLHKDEQRDLGANGVRAREDTNGTSETSEDSKGKEKIGEEHRRDKDVIEENEEEDGNEKGDGNEEEEESEDQVLDPYNIRQQIQKSRVATRMAGEWRRQGHKLSMPVFSDKDTAGLELNQFDSKDQDITQTSQDPTKRGKHKFAEIVLNAMRSKDKDTESNKDEKNKGESNKDENSELKDGIPHAWKSVQKNLFKLARMGISEETELHPTVRNRRQGTTLSVMSKTTSVSSLTSSSSNLSRTFSNASNRSSASTNIQNRRRAESNHRIRPNSVLEMSGLTEIGEEGEEEEREKLAENQGGPDYNRSRSNSGKHQGATETQEDHMSPEMLEMHQRLRSNSSSSRERRRSRMSRNAPYPGQYRKLEKQDSMFSSAWDRANTSPQRMNRDSIISDSSYVSDWRGLDWASVQRMSFDSSGNIVARQDSIYPPQNPQRYFSSHRVTLQALNTAISLPGLSSEQQFVLCKTTSAHVRPHHLFQYFSVFGPFRLFKVRKTSISESKRPLSRFFRFGVQNSYRVVPEDAQISPHSTSPGGTRNDSLKLEPYRRESCHPYSDLDLEQGHHNTMQSNENSESESYPLFRRLSNESNKSLERKLSVIGEVEDEDAEARNARKNQVNEIADDPESPVSDSTQPNLFKNQGHISAHTPVTKQIRHRISSVLSGIAQKEINHESELTVCEVLIQVRDPKQQSLLLTASRNLHLFGDRVSTAVVTETLVDWNSFSDLTEDDEEAKIAKLDSTLFHDPNCQGLVRLQYDYEMRIALQPLIKWLRCASFAVPDDARARGARSFSAAIWGLFVFIIWMISIGVLATTILQEGETKRVVLLLFQIMCLCCFMIYQLDFVIRREPGWQSMILLIASKTSIKRVQLVSRHLRSRALLCFLVLYTGWEVPLAVTGTYLPSTSDAQSSFSCSWCFDSMNNAFVVVGNLFSVAMATTIALVMTFECFLCKVTVDDFEFAVFSRQISTDGAINEFAKVMASMQLLGQRCRVVWPILTLGPVTILVGLYLAFVEKIDDFWPTLIPLLIIMIYSLYCVAQWAAVSTRLSQFIHYYQWMNTIIPFDQQDTLYRFFTFVNAARDGASRGVPLQGVVITAAHLRRMGLASFYVLAMSMIRLTQ